MPVNSWMIFHFPVDPVALGIPQYFDVIPKKDARDLTTIKARIEGSKKPVFVGFDDVDRDVQQMFSNSYRFNGLESDIGRYTKTLDDVWRDLASKAAKKAGRDVVEDGRVTKKARIS